MFCPNCGRDCGNDRFCGSCGTKLNQDAAQSAVWSVGQPCPHCGGTKLEGNHCAFCGAQLKVDIPAEIALWKNIPLGAYECQYGYLKLSNDRMVIKKDFRKKYARETVIPYGLISDADYHKNGFLSFGWLFVRWQENATDPFPTTNVEAAQDATTIVFNTPQETFMFQLYHAIKDYISEKS